MNATAFDQLGVDVNKAGALVGRPIQANTEQSRYIGAAPGVYGDSATEDVNKLSNFFHQQYAETVPGITEAKQEGKTLSLNTMLFDSKPREFTNIETEAPAPIKINVYDVGSGVEIEKKGKVAAQQTQVSEKKKPTSDLNPSPELQEELKINNLNLDDIVANFGKKAIKTVAAVGTAASQIIPGPVDTAVAGVLDPESMEVAESKGRGLVEQMTGQTEGVLPALGGTAGVAGEMITGGVADPEAPRRTSQFLASPMATVASGFINRNNEAIPDDTNTDGFLSR